MYPLRRLRQIRELALYLFGAVPETPKPIYETDTQCFSEERTAHGRAGIPHHLMPSGEGEPVGRIRFDEESGALTITRYAAGE